MGESKAPHSRHPTNSQIARAAWSSPINFSTSTARQLICCRFTKRIKGCFVDGFSWLMPRAYGTLLFLQELNGRFFHSFTAKDGAPRLKPGRVLRFCKMRFLFPLSLWFFRHSKK